MCIRNKREYFSLKICIVSELGLERESQIRERERTRTYLPRCAAVVDRRGGDLADQITRSNWKHRSVCGLKGRHVAIGETREASLWMVKEQIWRAIAMWNQIWSDESHSDLSLARQICVTEEEETMDLLVLCLFDTRRLEEELRCICQLEPPPQRHSSLLHTQMSSFCHSVHQTTSIWFVCAWADLTDPFLDRSISIDLL